jgi:hypothetical protein
MNSSLLKCQRTLLPLVGLALSGCVTQRVAAPTVMALPAARILRCFSSTIRLADSTPPHRQVESRLGRLPRKMEPPALPSELVLARRQAPFSEQRQDVPGTVPRSGLAVGC